MSSPRDSMGHRTRISDASSFDEICIYCSAHDGIGTLGGLAYPCKASEQKKTKIDKEYDNESK